MLRNYVSIVSESVNEGFERGLNLFIDSLEQDLIKTAVIDECGLENILTYQITEVLEQNDIEDLESINDIEEV